MMNVRPLPILLAAAVTGILLFGGWFAYNRLAVEKPLEQTIASVEGVADSHPVITRDTVTVELQLENNADLSEIYQHIRTEGASVIGSRELKLEIAQSEHEELERIWSSVLFDVAEAMENRRYAAIPAVAEQLMQEHQGLAVETELDETNVYITMKKADAVKYIVLPRIPASLGVWPDV